MITFNITELYKTLFKTLKKFYIGELYIVIESIEFNFNDEEEDAVLALDPWGYTVKGRYGRCSDETPMHESFSLDFHIDDSMGVVSGRFEDLLLKS